MSSIQFNYFADEKGELIIRKELLNKFSPLYIRDYSGNNKDFLECSIENIADFIPFEGKKTLLTANKEKEHIIEDEDRFVSKYISPIIEYTPSKIRDENIYVGGRLAYFMCSFSLFAVSNVFLPSNGIKSVIFSMEHSRKSLLFPE